MYPLRRLSLSTVFALFFSLLANAQSAKDSVYFYLPTLSSGKEGQVVNIPVKVRGFSNLISAQFIVQWDSTRAQYIGVDNFGIPSINEQSHFGYIGMNPDKIRFVWFENNITPQRIDNDGTIFNLKLKLIGRKDEGCSIGFIEDATTIFEFLDKDGKEIKYGFKNGAIKISGSSAVAEQPANTITCEKPFPNPFFEETLIPLKLSENQEIKLDIFNESGVKVYDNFSSYEFGTHFVHINKNTIPSAGIYFYHFTNAKGESVSGKIINRQ